MNLHDDPQLAELLESSVSVALVGASPKPWRDSYAVMAYLIEQGFQVTPINPNFAGQQLLGQTIVARLADCPNPIDLVDIFRNSDDAGAVVDDAIEHRHRLGLKAVWMQLGVVNQPAAERAAAAGLSVVMNRCPKIEIPRLGLPPKQGSLRPLVKA